jgi:hypothetical protein
VHELARLALGGNEVVPAAGDVGFFVEAQDVGGDGIAVVMIVKEPAVAAGFEERSLNRLEIHEVHSSCRVSAVSFQLCS